MCRTIQTNAVLDDDPDYTKHGIASEVSTNIGYAIANAFADHKNNPSAYHIALAIADALEFSHASESAMYVAISKAKHKRNGII